MSAVEVLGAHLPVEDGFGCAGCEWHPKSAAATDDAEFAAHQLGALNAAGYEVIEASPGSSQEAEPKHPCRGFQWVGQSFASCDGCGLPYWEHTHDTRMRDGAGPFDEEPFDYVPITDAQKAACKAKWGGDR